MAITQRKKKYGYTARESRKKIFNNQNNRRTTVQITELQESEEKKKKAISYKGNPSANRRDNNEAKEQIFEYRCV